MMTVLNCVAVEHDIRLVILGVIICVIGSWAVLCLFHRGSNAARLQKTGWHLLAAAVSGASIWCTHFVSMLSYDPGVPVSFEPVMTLASFLAAMIGTAFGFTVAHGGWGRYAAGGSGRYAAGGPGRYAAAAGGGIVGLSIAAMHYMGMHAYRVQGLVSWDLSYLAASILIAVTLAAAALHIATRSERWSDRYRATGVLVLAIVGLHFTGMAAFRVTPLLIDGAFSNPGGQHELILAVAIVALVILGAGLAIYLLDGNLRAQSLERLYHLTMQDCLAGRRSAPAAATDWGPEARWRQPPGTRPR
ncbi:MHYT domain-containing protein [Plastoroseomonas hellenica]|uniref:MHYT domain-containing protein n=1 Tax=Plastoroseomonas hellenica TaxID=2687306 RepID=UPI001BA64245|nr:MHYT domain-containing protein [Plastoroseomonas hellenica]MBR0646460.1 hypothetical protein [Plastoroseomonas hellenica]